MILSRFNFDVAFHRRLYSNTISPKKFITAPSISHYSPSGEHITPSICSTIPFIFAEENYRIHQKGVEIRPVMTTLLTNIAQGDHAVLDAFGHLKESDSMMNIKPCVLRHQSKAFATCTGRNVIYGPSLTSIKKKYWPFILNPITGYRYILLDFGQQEPAISAYFASDRWLQTAYLQGDLYIYIGRHPSLAELDRETLKKLVLPYSYGQQPEAYAKQHGVSSTTAARYWQALREVFHLVDQELNLRAQLAFRNGFVRCLDWAARVTPLSNPLAVRNWPVQAAGADIMRRAVIGLAETGIDLRLTIHDAFLIRVPIAEQDQQIAKAIVVLKQASALVLDGFELNVRLDGVFDGQVSGEVM